jgi:hypothetical protein
MRTIEQALANAARIRDELPHLIQPSASDYDMVLLAARLAEAEVLMSEAWRRNESLRARLAAAEALLSIAGQELLIGMIDPTATCYPQIRAFLTPKENERE